MFTSFLPSQCIGNDHKVRPQYKQSSVRNPFVCRVNSGDRDGQRIVVNEELANPFNTCL